jgi:1-acyl-sn-glycerol-3-phosphate acyltransferase
MTTWHSQEAPEKIPIGPLGWGVLILRGSSIALLTYGGLAVLLALRAVEWPLAGLNRPVTPFITQFVCRVAVRVIGITYRIRGTPMHHVGAVVANHGSWLDIFALNACQRVYFVSKSEVARWPGIGWLARATGTAFIERDAKKARAQRDLFEERIRAGHKLLFFPEGTSTDSRRVLPFKSTLFAAFFAKDMERVMQIQPVSVIYTAPIGCDSRFYGWWGDMAFGPHFLQVLAQLRQGAIEVVFHDPVNVADFASRKELAAHCEEVVRAGLDAGMDGSEG